jgi:hypothetical protein
LHSGLKVDQDWKFSDISLAGRDNETTVIEYDGKLLFNSRVDLVNEGLRKLRTVYQLDFATNQLTYHPTDKTFEAFISCQGSLDSLTLTRAGITRKIYLMSFPDSSDAGGIV